MREEPSAVRDWLVNGPSEPGTRTSTLIASMSQKVRKVIFDGHKERETLEDPTTRKASHTSADLFNDPNWDAARTYTGIVKGPTLPRFGINDEHLYYTHFVEKKLLQTVFWFLGLGVLRPRGARQRALAVGAVA